MKNKRIIKTYACILEFGGFEPEEHSALYTPLRKKALSGMKNEKALMQSAAVELAYLAAARMAQEGCVFNSGEDDALERIDLEALKKRFEYAYSENGKPVLCGAHMSLSHTSGTALAVISTAPVGADIERERHVSVRIAERIMNEAEQKEFDLLPENEKNAAMIECWTAKESFLKLTGEGIAAGADMLHYDRKNAVVRREMTGESANVIRLDSEGCLACICQMDEPELELMRLPSAENAARFIKKR